MALHFRRLAVFSLGLLGLTGTGCHSKDMSEKESLDTWLDKNFPKKYEVTGNLRDLQPKNWFQKKMSSIVSLREDPEVQFELIWYKDREDLGLTVEEVKTESDKRKTEAGLSRLWFDALSKGGLNRFSVGAIEQAVYILPFANPTAAYRKEMVDKICSVLNNGIYPEQTSVWIEILEDSCYHQPFQDIIPYSYWRRIDAYHKDHLLYSLNFERDETNDPVELNKHWEANASSLPAMKMASGDGFTESQHWAKIHLDFPYYIEGERDVEVETDESNPTTVHFRYPLYKQKPNEGRTDVDEQFLGYVTCLYHPDSGQVTDIDFEKQQ